MLLGGLPSKVTAVVRTRMHDIEVEDEANAILEYKNGAWGYYYTSTCEIPQTMRLEICGDKAKLIYDEEKLRLLVFEKPISEHNRTAVGMWDFPKVKEEQLELPVAETGSKEIIRNFCAAILHGEKLISPGITGMWSMEFINAVGLSGRTGKSVSIPVDREKFDRFLEKMKRSSIDKKAVKTQRVTDPRRI